MESISNLMKQGNTNNQTQIQNANQNFTSSKNILDRLNCMNYISLGGIASKVSKRTTCNLARLEVSWAWMWRPELQLPCGDDTGQEGPGVARGRPGDGHWSSNVTKLAPLLSPATWRLASVTYNDHNNNLLSNCRKYLDQTLKQSLDISEFNSAVWHRHRGNKKMIHLK